MGKDRFRGFLSRLEKRYLEFLEYEKLEGMGNRNEWNEKENMPYNSLDYQIRWKTREAFKDLKLVCEKIGYIELSDLFSDREVVDNIKFINEIFCKN